MLKFISASEVAPWMCPANECGGCGTGPSGACCVCERGDLTRKILEVTGRRSSMESVPGKIRAMNELIDKVLPFPASEHGNWARALAVKALGVSAQTFKRLELNRRGWVENEHEEEEEGVDFSQHSVAHGMKRGEVLGIDAALRLRLVRLIARIAEKAYRRGYQHGEYLNRPENIGHEWRIDPSDLRHCTEHSLDVSPYVDSPHMKSSSRARLLMECREVLDLGFIEGWDEPS